MEQNPAPFVVFMADDLRPSRGRSVSWPLGSRSPETGFADQMGICLPWVSPVPAAACASSSAPRILRPTGAPYSASTAIRAGRCRPAAGLGHGLPRRQGSPRARLLRREAGDEQHRTPAPSPAGAAPAAQENPPALVQAGGGRADPGRHPGRPARAGMVEARRISETPARRPKAALASAPFPRHIPPASRGFPWPTRAGGQGAVIFYGGRGCFGFPPASGLATIRACSGEASGAGRAGRPGVPAGCGL